MHYFADGQKEKKIGVKMSSDTSKTLKQAITLVVLEKVYLRNFSLYSWKSKCYKYVHKLDTPQKAGKTQQINYNTANIIFTAIIKSNCTRECRIPWSKTNKGNDWPKYQQYQSPSQDGQK